MPGPFSARGVGVGSVCFSRLSFVGPSTAGLAVSGLPVLIICASVTLADAGAPMRASFFTPLCLTVGALQKTYESDSDSDSNKVVVFQVNMKVSYEMRC